MQISDQDKQRLQHIATLINNGNIAEAKSLLADLQRTSPPSAPAWYLVSFTVGTKEEQVAAINSALAIDSTYEPARQALRQLHPAPRPIPINPYVWTPTPKPSRSLPVKRLALLGILAFIIVAGLTIGLTTQQTPSSVAVHATSTRLWTKTATLLPTLLPIPVSTALPVPFELAMSTGQAEASLFINRYAQFSTVKGNFALKGAAHLTFSNDTLSISVVDEANLEQWTFEFAASRFQANTLYADAVSFGSRIKTRPRINVQNTKQSCGTMAAGKFIVEQLVPILIVSFTQSCNESLLSGVLSISPPPKPGYDGTQLDLKDSEGEVSIELNAASREMLSRKSAKFAVEGTASFSHSSAETAYVELVVQDYNTSERWKIEFYAPNFAGGRVYEVTNEVKTDKYPTRLIISRPDARPDIPQCDDITGRFSFEQRGDELMISFVYQCDHDPRQQLHGTIHYRPQSRLSPTPTIPADQLFARHSDRGQIRVELYSEGDEPIGGGAGNFVLEAYGDFTRLKNYRDLIRIHFSFSDERNTWQFKFWAPAMHLNETYQIVNDSYQQGRLSPTMSIVRTERGKEIYCELVNGHFTVEEQSPSIVISFIQECDDDPTQVLYGKLTFTSMPPPTPTQVVLPPTRTRIPKPRTSTPIPLLTQSRPTWTPASDVITTDSTPAAASIQQLFQQPTLGKVEVTGEWISRDTNAFALQGLGTIAISSKNNQLTISIMENNTGARWFFNFYATDFATGKSYEHVPVHTAKVTQLPSMSISNGRTLCTDLDGSFRFDQQGTDLIVTFTHLCNAFPSASIQGTIRFTPN